MRMTLIEVPQSSREFGTAYDRLASAYDAFTGGGDYGAWAAGLLRELARHGLRGGRAVEVGCGTGRTTEALVQAGYAVVAYDPSSAMLERARARLGTNARCLVGGLPDLPAGRPAELTVALNDVLNYVAPGQLPAAVAALARRTERAGIVLFDVNTDWTYERGPFAATFVRRAGGRLFVSEALPSPAPGAHAFAVHIFTPRPCDPATCTHVVSSHRQWRHDHGDVLAALRAAGLEPLETLGQHDDGRRDAYFDEATHSKRVYLARRP